MSRLLRDERFPISIEMELGHSDLNAPALETTFSSGRLHDCTSIPDSSRCAPIAPLAPLNPDDRIPCRSLQEKAFI